MLRTGVVLVAILSVVSAAHASATPSDREVITVDDGPDQRITIVRDGGSSSSAWQEGGHQALAYTDAAGRKVRVYGDRPVTRTEVDARIASAEREGERARAEGQRAAEEGRRAAAEARREAADARQQVEQARSEGQREAAEGRREAEAARHEAERARAEAAQAMDWQR